MGLSLMGAIARLNTMLVSHLGRCPTGRAHPILSSALDAFLLPLMKSKAMKSGAGEVIPERNKVFGDETRGLASGGHAAPWRASGDDALHSIIAWKSSVFRAGRPDSCLT